jgi:hypothetical protein
VSGFYDWKRRGVFDSLPEQERFTLSAILVVSTLHDIEKPFRAMIDNNGLVTTNPDLKTKQQRNDFKTQLLQEYDITFDANQQNAWKFAEGMRDADYSPHDRVMSPMAVLVHAADILSARGSYNFRQ